MTRNEERLIWSAALALFSPQVLATWVLEGLRSMMQGMPDGAVPRLVSHEGLAEVAGLILEDVAHGHAPTLLGQRVLYREHLRVLLQLRYAITGHVLMRIPVNLLTPRLSEIRLSGDLGL